MSKRKKFSQFELPKNNLSDLYLVGYEVGTGENGENTSIRVKANDLAFSVTGAAGVSSLNGFSGSIQLLAGTGLDIVANGNVITLNSTIEPTTTIEVDNTFNRLSTNPQSGVAIANELGNYANTTNSNVFSGENQFNGVNVVGKLRINGTASFNNTVTVQGQELSSHMAKTDAHIADTTKHFIGDEKRTFTNTVTHLSDNVAHITANERESWNKAVASPHDLTSWVHHDLTTKTHTAYPFRDDIPVKGIVSFSLSNTTLSYPTTRKLKYVEHEVLSGVSSTVDSSHTTSGCNMTKPLHLVVSQGSTQNYTSQIVLGISKNAISPQAGQSCKWEFDDLTLATGKVTKFTFISNPDLVTVGTTLPASSYTVGLNGDTSNIATVCVPLWKHGIEEIKGDLIQDGFTSVTVEGEVRHMTIGYAMVKVVTESEQGEYMIAKLGRNTFATLTDLEQTNETLEETNETLAEKADRAEILNTVITTDYDNMQNWATDNAVIRNWVLSADVVPNGKVNKVGIPCGSFKNQDATTVTTAHYLVIETLNSNEEITNRYISLEPKKLEYLATTFFNFEEFTLDLGSTDKLAVKFSMDGVEPTNDVTVRAIPIKINGNVTASNGSKALKEDRGTASWCIRTVFKHEVETPIKDILLEHTTNMDIHLTTEQMTALIELLQNKDALIGLLG